MTAASLFARRASDCAARKSAKGLLHVFSAPASQLRRSLLWASVCAALAGVSLTSATALAETATATENAAATSSSRNVGEVSLVLGIAYVEGADNQRHTLRTGDAVSISDRIFTEANGHVHIRFVDDALVSVRPDSLLEIQRYDYDPADPAQNSIKLNLVEGVTRAISGEGAKASRDRFRLNTPIAAIGVRGTDFVVSANGESVRALVNEGAIVVAPFSNECLADNLGPCAVNAVELSQDSLQVVQLDDGTPLPRLMPASEEENGAAPQVEVASSDEEAEEKTAGTGVYLEAVTSRKVTEVASILQPRPPAIPDFTPENAVTSGVVADDQLVWGRWGGGAGQGELERITLAYADVSGSGREVTVGKGQLGGDGYSLYRADNGSDRIKLQNLGVVSFNLDSAQAFYHSDTGVVAMQVNSGALSVDFGRNSFNTQLGMAHEVTGKVNFSAAGSLSEEGFFRTGNGQLTGAVSMDGSEAGYLFVKDMDGGSIQGLTLWDTP